MTAGLLLIVVLWPLAFLYSGLAAALPALHPVRLEHRARRGDHHARALQQWVRASPEAPVVLWLAAGLCSAAVMALLFLECWILGGPKTSWLAPAIFLPVQVLAVDLLARQVFRRCPFRVLCSLWWLVVAARGLLAPAARLLHDLVARMPSRPLPRPDSAAELLRITASIPTVSSTELEMVRSVLAFRALTAADLAQPLGSMPQVPAESTLAEAVARREIQSRRHVIVMGADGQPLGAANPGEAVQSGATSARMQSFARPLISIAADMPAWDVLTKLRRAQTPVALIHALDGESLLGMVTEETVTSRLLGREPSRS